MAWEFQKFLQGDQEFSVVQINKPVIILLIWKENSRNHPYFNAILFYPFYEVVMKETLNMQLLIMIQEAPNVWYGLKTKQKNQSSCDRSILKLESTLEFSQLIF